METTGGIVVLVLVVEEWPELLGLDSEEEPEIQVKSRHTSEGGRVWSNSLSSF